MNDPLNAILQCIDLRLELLGEVDAIRSWATDRNQVAMFMRDCLVREPGARVKSGDVYARYRDWAAAHGIRRMLEHKGLTVRLARLGVVPVKGGCGVRMLHGARLRPAEQGQSGATRRTRHGDTASDQQT